LQISFSRLGQVAASFQAFDRGDAPKVSPLDELSSRRPDVVGSNEAIIVEI
jgi:hypothetical protein